MISLWLPFGIIIVFIPTLAAANAFSFKPPMGSTLPRKVISPVIATSERTFFPENTDKIAVAIVIPALGPSFGVAPSGTCTCTFCVSNNALSMPYLSAFALTKVSAARADSFITSPSLPVSKISPFPSTRVASTVRVVPPYAVQASPFTAPTSLERFSSFNTYMGVPNSSITFFFVTLTLRIFLLSAYLTAIFLHTEPTVRSNVLTPASKVYPSMRAVIPSSLKIACFSEMPFAFNCLGIKYRFAISSFSCRV